MALVIATAGVVWLLEASPDGPRVTTQVEVIGPEGAIFEGNVTSGPTAYDALMEAARVGDFQVVSTGAGASRFVTQIAGYRNAGAGGWCFAIDSGSGFVYAQIGAGQALLEDGDRLRWIYHEDGCPGA